MSSNDDYDDSSALTALAAAASIARSGASSPCSSTGSRSTPNNDSPRIGDASSISSSFFSSNDEPSSAGRPIITHSKKKDTHSADSLDISSDETTTIATLLKKVDTTCDDGSRKRKSQNYSSSSESSSSSDNDEDVHVSKEFLISRIPKPKRPMTAYNFFFQNERKKIVGDSQRGKKKNRKKSSTIDHQVSFESIGKTIGRRWKEVPKEDLMRYQALAEKESRRYKREIKIYNAKVASVKAKMGLRAVKKMRPTPTSSAKKAPSSSANSITDSNAATATTLGTTGTDSDQGDVLHDFISSLSKEQIEQLLRLHNGGSKPDEVPLPSSQPQSILAQVFQGAAPSPSSVAGAASSAQAMHQLSSVERGILQNQGQMIAQLQQQIQMLQAARQNQQLLQASLSIPLLQQQQQQQQQLQLQVQNGQYWSVNDTTRALLSTNALRNPTMPVINGPNPSALVAAALAAQQQPVLQKGNGSFKI